MARPGFAEVFRSEFPAIHRYARRRIGRDGADDIAAALSLPVGTVKSRLHRARRRLRNQLAPIGQSDDEMLSIRRSELG